MTEAAREAARRLYKRYNYSNGPFASYELSSLLAETYEYLKIRRLSLIKHLSQLKMTSKAMKKF